MIAGSRQGIGRALAEHYVGRGHTVFGLSRRPSDLVHERYHHICADVTDGKMVHQAFARISESGLPIDVLVYCAGVKTSSYVLLTREEDAATMLRTSLLGAFLVTRDAVRLMKRNGFGRFIYISSVLVPLGDPGSVIYGVSHAGLQQLAFALAHEFPLDNITFNALGLSIFPTPMTAAVSERVLNETRAGLIKKQDMEVDEVAGAIDFLASDAARQITGQTIYFGGVR